MIYVQNVLIPKSTSNTSPICQRLQVTKGLVYKIEIEFPPGPEGTTHILIQDGSSPIWPSNPGADFASDSYTISFDDTHIKFTPPFEFQIYGYNTDSENAHTVQVRIGMVSKDIFIARFLPTYTYDHLLKVIKEMKEEEIKRAQAIMQTPFSWIT